MWAAVKVAQQLMAEWSWEEEEAALHHETAHYLSLLELELGITVGKNSPNMAIG